MQTVAWDKVNNSTARFGLTVKKDATVNDTIKLIVDTINNCSNTPEAQNFTAELMIRSKNLDDFLHKLFEFLCKHVKYKLDPEGREQIITFKRMLQDINNGSAQFDCKKFTVFISTVLKCAGIPSFLKVISYDGKNYEHIYVIVPQASIDDFINTKSYLTLDPVASCKYDNEIPHVKARVIDLNNNDMNLELLGRNAPQVNLNSRFLDYLGTDGVVRDASGAIVQRPINVNSRFLQYLHGAAASIDNMMQPENSTGTELSKQELDDLITATLSSIVYAAKANNSILPSAFNPEEMQANTAFQPLSGLGSLKTWLKKVVNGVKTVVNNVKDAVQDAIDAVKKVGAAPIRGAFLLVMDINLFGLAGSFKNAWQKDPGKIKNWWGSWGGDWSVLKTSIEKGSGVQLNGIRGLGLDPATITLAATITASAIALLKEIGNVITTAQEKQAVNTSAAAITSTNKQLQPATPAQANAGFKALLPASSDPGTSETNYLPWIAAAAIAAKVLL